MSDRARPATAERLSPRGMVALRAAPEAMAGVAEAAGVPDPGVRRWEGAGDRALVWMSPDERLLICPRWDAAALAGALAEVAGLAADVSDMRAAFRVSGPGARDVLAKGAAVDLSRAAFGEGDVRRTHVAEVAAMIRGTGEAAFELLCFRSVEDHLARWLELATLPGRAPAVL
ncbi:MAG TPA: sarcosine oxidase subunit gamma family protein [Paracoccaceae bacterium]|nr:sarcosine oxidase subunit gamma family protein [Paracoccaceae bacterium]